MSHFDHELFKDISCGPKHWAMAAANTLSDIDTIYRDTIWPMTRNLRYSNMYSATGGECNEPFVEHVVVLRIQLLGTCLWLPTQLVLRLEKTVAVGCIVHTLYDPRLQGCLYLQRPLRPPNNV